MLGSNTIPSPAVDEGLLRPHAVFAAKPLEQAFRSKQFSDDLRMARFCVLLGPLGFPLFALNDYAFFGPGTQLLVLSLIRLGFLLLSVFTWRQLRRCTAPAAADRVLLGWCLLLVTLACYVSSTRPPSYTGHAILNLGMVLAVYCVVPLPLALQALVAVPFSLTALGLAVWSGVDVLSLRALSGSYALANILGAAMSWQFNCRRRLMFLASLRETELRTSLEEALAEIKTLRGVLSICAWCKRIRDEKEAWQPIEAYVAHRTHAEFTHGICPACLRQQLGEEKARQVLG